MLENKVLEPGKSELPARVAAPCKKRLRVGLTAFGFFIQFLRNEVLPSQGDRHSPHLLMLLPANG